MNSFSVELVPLLDALRSLRSGGAGGLHISPAAAARRRLPRVAPAARFLDLCSD